MEEKASRFNFSKKDEAKEVDETEVPEEVKEDKRILANKVVGQDPEVLDITDKGMTDILSALSGYDRQGGFREGKTVEFRSEEYEFKKFLLTFEKEGVPFAVKDLQLANVRMSDIGFMSDVLAFASQLYVNGAINTSKFFFEKILYYLHLSISVDGFGRKELSTVRQVSTNENKEEPKKGFQLIR
ncbi:MAG: hypothetical protein QW051_00670 [Candidatus Aenigmatarchaeota archaeon]